MGDREDSDRRAAAQGVPPSEGLQFNKLAELKQLTKISFEDSDVGDVFLQGACEIPQLRDIGINGCPVTDKAVQQLLKLKSLKRLYINSLHITDAALETIRKIHTLTAIKLLSPALTDAVWKQIAQMPNVHDISIGRYEPSEKFRGIGISALAQHGIGDFALRGALLEDDSFREIASLPHLRQLNLAASRISGTGLEHLGQLKHIERLWLPGTGVSAAAIAELRKMKPDCEIIQD